MCTLAAAEAVLRFLRRVWGLQSPAAITASCGCSTSGLPVAGARLGTMLVVPLRKICSRTWEKEGGKQNSNLAGTKLCGRAEVLQSQGRSSPAMGVPCASRRCPQHSSGMGLPELLPAEQPAMQREPWGGGTAVHEALQVLKGGSPVLRAHVGNPRRIRAGRQRPWEGPQAEPSHHHRAAVAALCAGCTARGEEGPGPADGFVCPQLPLRSGTNR